MKANKRNLKIQYRHEKQVYSLPAIEVPTMELEKADVETLLANPVICPVVVHLLNNQCHISFSSKAGERVIKETGDYDGKTAHEALGAVVEAGVDFYDEIVKHAEKLAERQAKGAKGDKIVELIRTKWEGSSKKLEFLQRLGLSETLVDASAEEVEASYHAIKNAAEDWL